MKNNSRYFAVLVDILQLHNCNIRNNRQVLALVFFCNFHIRKNTDRHLLALFPLLNVHIRDK
jgi:hypothetical protein